MNLPFTPEQFFNVFAQYNNALAWAAAGLWIAAGVAVSAAWNDRSGRSHGLLRFLAVLWAWNAIAYHAAFFAQINPAAWFFAAAFALQAVFFAIVARRSEFHFFTAAGWRRKTGGALILFALAYPVLNITFGHEYPGTPTFGVPCPTAILTLGLLLTVRARAARWLAIIPMLWGFVGGWAALLLNVWSDYVLVLASTVVAADMLRHLTLPARHERIADLHADRVNRVRTKPLLRRNPTSLS